MGFYQLRREQLVNTSLEKLWDFISSPQNLKKITPEHMGFDITSEKLPNKVYEGMIISYIVKPLLGIKTIWVTEITHVKENEYFIDEQRVGPYTLWHHQHIIKQEGNQIRMTDIVSYKPPFGFLGSIANKIIIRKKLKEIFNYRTKVLDKIFN